MIRSLLNFIDPYVFNVVQVQQIGKESGLQIMSRVLDIRCHGEVLDKAGQAQLVSHSARLCQARLQDGYV